MDILKSQARSWDMSASANMDSLSPPNYTKLRSEELKLKSGKTIVQRLVLISGKYKVGWVCDIDANNCMRCNRKFDFFFNRKHHCRLCGYVVCGKCGEDRINIPLLTEGGGSRVCTDCGGRRSLCDYAESTNAQALPRPSNTGADPPANVDRISAASSGSECSTLGRHTINTTMRDTLTESLPEIYYDPASTSSVGHQGAQGLDFSEWTDRYSMHINTAHRESQGQPSVQVQGQSTVPRMNQAPTQPIPRSRSGSTSVAITATGVPNVTTAPAVPAVDTDVDADATAVDTDADADATAVDTDVDADATAVDTDVDTAAVDVDADADATAVDVDADATAVDTDVDTTAVDVDADATAVDTDVDTAAVDADADATAVDTDADADATAVDTDADATAVDTDADADATAVDTDADTTAVDTDADATAVDTDADAAAVDTDADATAVDTDADATAAAVDTDADAAAVDTDADATAAAVPAAADATKSKKKQKKNKGKR